jgi:hypothetical protein
MQGSDDVDVKCRAEALVRRVRSDGSRRCDGIDVASEAPVPPRSPPTGTGSCSHPSILEPCLRDVFIVPLVEDNARVMRGLRNCRGQKSFQ